MRDGRRWRDGRHRLQRKITRLYDPSSSSPPAFPFIRVARPSLTRRIADRIEVVRTTPLGADGSNDQNLFWCRTSIGFGQCLCKSNEWCYVVGVLSSDICSKVREDSKMANAKRASKAKRRSKAAPVLGIAGVSLMAGGASASTAGAVADVPSQNTVPPQVITLGEEEISDVSLATFYVFDKENAGKPQLGEQLARGCGRGCGGCRGCRGCRGCVRGCGGCGGCGGCCISVGRCLIC
jgi:hypothetical protein